LRPAQDCELGYGAALVWMEIEELTPTRFRERQIDRWSGSFILPANGLHTFNQEDGVSVIDMKRPVWKWSRRPRP
jgi:hypothetical protein